jgi:hypothetical protein
MNTVFKLYFQSWLLLGIAAGPALAWLLPAMRRQLVALAAPLATPRERSSVAPAAGTFALAGLSRTGVHRTPLHLSGRHALAARTHSRRHATAPAYNAAKSATGGTHNPAHAAESATTPPVVRPLSPWTERHATLAELSGLRAERWSRGRGSQAAGGQVSHSRCAGFEQGVS